MTPAGPLPREDDPAAPRTGSLRLGRLGGFPVFLDRSWFLIVIVVVLLYTPVLRRTVPQIGAWAYVLAGVFCLLLAVSVLLHELAHAWAARAFGWLVSHIVLSLMGGHTSFGTTQQSWGASFVVSVLGPVANLVIGFGGWLALGLLPMQGLSTVAEVGIVLIEMTSWANLFVGVFNLIPGLPLDGGRALEAVAWGLTGRQHVGTTVAAWAGRLIALAIVVAVALTGLWQSLPVVVLAVMLAWMLFSGASAGLRRSRAAQAMEGVRAGQLMEPAIAVPGTTSLDKVEALLRESFDNRAGTAVPLGPVAVVALDHAGLPTGVATPAQVTSVPPAERAGAVLSTITDPLPRSASIRPGLSGIHLLEVTAGAHLSTFVVVDDDGTPLGVLRAARLNDVLRGAGLIP
ncbi:hypothetical protein GWK18_01520 [Kocuria sp. JC486]|uniref:Zinc metalloprotease n=1 Tax=Kocuria soli TaxID=2485125 RepID=A0A3N3ZR42_9MICC|nr:site-2 protease family protein [Kocuria soli]NHU84290.1 hypothetical protein [Kocuria sp. JC486]ROZ63735.1 hypothetical protein EDL96_05110 [Kocuria soli]